MTRSQLRARLKEALAAATPTRPAGRPRNVVQTIGQAELLRKVRSGDAIVVSREVAELLVERLEPRRPGGTP